jgi:hypothetical protein
MFGIYSFIKYLFCAFFLWRVLYYFTHPMNGISRWPYLHFWHSRTVMGHDTSHPWNTVNEINKVLPLVSVREVELLGLFPAWVLIDLVRCMWSGITTGSASLSLVWSACVSIRWHISSHLALMPVIAQRKRVVCVAAFTDSNNELKRYLASSSPERCV